MNKKQFQLPLNRYLLFSYVGPPVPAQGTKGSAPPASTYVTPGLQPGAWQHPPISPPVQPGYPAALPPVTAYQQQQQPQRVVVVVNAPNFGKNL